VKGAHNRKNDRGIVTAFENIKAESKAFESSVLFITSWTSRRAPSNLGQHFNQRPINGFKPRMPPPVQSYTLGKVLIGVGTAVLANLVFLSNSIAVNRFKPLAAEICFLRALLQIALFSTLHTVNTLVCAKKSDEKASRPDINFNLLATDYKGNPMLTQGGSLLGYLRRKWRLMASVTGLGLTLPVMTMAVYVGVVYLPVSDVVVFCHTASVFTLLFSACILGQRITALKALLCLTTLTGSVMVMQPTFIFDTIMGASGHQASENKNDKTDSSTPATTVSFTNLTSDAASAATPSGGDTSEHDYLVGVTACLVASVSSALSNVLSASSKECPMPVIMVVGGFGTLALTLVCPLIGDFFPNRFIDSSVTVVGPLPDQLPIVAGVAMGSLVGGLLVVYSCQKAPPPLVAVVRSSEIILALFSDYVIFQTAKPEALHIGGAVVTLISVALMACSDVIQAKILDRWSCCNTNSRDNSEQSTDFADEEDRLHLASSEKPAVILINTNSILKNGDLVSSQPTRLSRSP